MIDRLITQYIANNKRLVVPGLGTYIRKDSGETVFVELMRKDDGVLRDLLLKDRGINLAEADSIINNYVHKVQSASRTAQGYVVPNLGILKLDSKGILNLFDAPHAPQNMKAEVTKVTEVEKPTPAASNQSGVPEPNKRYHAKPKKKGIDIILIIALIVAGVAIAVIVYGLMADENPIQNMRPTQESLQASPTDQDLQ